MGSVRFAAKFQGSLSEGKFGSEKVLLLKPETFMNLSGQSVGEAMRFYKLTPGDVTVFHDELDLAPGKVRVKQGGGHAGHNGLRSIHQHIGEAYGRVRLGIGHPGHKDRVAGYVLSDFAKADADWLDDVLRGVADGAPDLAAGRQRAVSERGVDAHGAGAQRQTGQGGGHRQQACRRGAGRSGARCALGASETRGPVPMSDAASRVRAAFHSQGKSCAMLGSPFMGRLMPLSGSA
jgi:PTH1 family peptidyl-tRNA hydrolase